MPCGVYHVPSHSGTRWMEQDPAELLASVRQCLSEVGKTLQSKALQLKGVGITNQRETTILWDKTTGHALHRAIGGRGTTHSTHAHIHAHIIIIYTHTHAHVAGVCSVV